MFAAVLAAGALHIAGKLLFVSASWGLSIPLMRPGATGESQGVFAAGEATATTLGPALMTALVAGPRAGRGALRHLGRRDGPGAALGAEDARAGRCRYAA